MAKGISRRQLGSSLARFAAVASGLGAAVLEACTGSYPAELVGHAGEIPVGGSKIFTYPDDTHPSILLRPADNTYVAFSRLCTHATCPVFYEPIQNLLTCPCHGGAFSASDGSVVAGPPPKPLPRITLERRGQDIVATGVRKG